MSLDNEALSEIKKYMDEKGHVWKLESTEAARISAAQEIQFREENKIKRLQLWSAIAGVSLLAIGSLAYSGVLGVARTTARSEAHEVLKASEEVIKFHKNYQKDSIQAIIDARTATETSSAKATELLEETEVFTEKIKSEFSGLSTAKNVIQNQIEQLKSTTLESTKLFESIESSAANTKDKTGEIDSLVSKASELTNELNNRIANITKISNLADRLLSEDGQIKQIVESVLEDPILRQEIAAAATLPKGTIVYFNNAYCPSGWDEYTDGHGRYVVGVRDQTNIGKSVGIELSDLENRSAGPHTHPLEKAGEHSHDISESQDVWTQRIGDPAGLWLDGRGAGKLVQQTLSSAGSHAHSIINNSGPNGTNSPYVLLRMCVKN